MENKKLQRSSNKMIAGVCSGLADYIGLDPMIVRLAFAIFTLLGGAGILVYVILWIVMPEGDAVTPPPAP